MKKDHKKSKPSKDKVKPKLLANPLVDKLEALEFLCPNSKLHDVRMIVGDWSGDGHEKTENFSIVSNRSQQEIVAAHDKTIKSLKYDPLSDLDEYEVQFLSKKSINCFVELGVTWESIGWDVPSPALGRSSDVIDQSINDDIGTEDVVALYMVLAAVSDPDLRYANRKSDYIHVGGYGIFH